MRHTGLPAATLEKFFALFAATEKTVTVYSQGVNQSASGTDKVNAIINCHLATGRIGKPGMGPFSVTGQPNAMGGREVGGLANMLAAHMNIEDAAHRERVQRFWNSPTIATRPGLKAVDMFRAVADGRIKALWIMATNPVVSMPEAENVEAAIRDCPFVVVSDVTAATDTARLAARAPAGRGVGREERHGHQLGAAHLAPAQLPAAARRRPSRLVDHLRGRQPHGTWRGLRLCRSRRRSLPSTRRCPASRTTARATSTSARWPTLDGADYEDLEPFQWPRTSAVAGPARACSPTAASSRPTAKARFVEVHASPPSRCAAPGFPLTLNTGRVRDHWHTMTRTGKSARLSQHCAEPFVEIHPHDAARHHIGDADLVRVSTGLGAILVRALVTPRQQPGSIFVPMHWNDQFASRARVDVLVGAVVDPISGQPASKNVPVRIERFVAATYGFAVLRRKPQNIPAAVLGHCQVQRRLAARDGVRRRAGRLDAAGGRTRRCRRPDLPPIATPRRGGIASPATTEDQLAGTVFLAPEPVAVSRDWAIAQLGRRTCARGKRTSAIAGRPGKGARRSRGDRLRLLRRRRQRDRQRRRRAAARRCRPSAKRCRPAPTAAPAAPRSATLSNRNARARRRRLSANSSCRLRGRQHARTFAAAERLAPLSAPCCGGAVPRDAGRARRCSAANAQ